MAFVEDILMPFDCKIWRISQNEIVSLRSTFGAGLPLEENTMASMGQMCNRLQFLHVVAMLEQKSKTWLALILFDCTQKCIF
jgi:hypothetical protein